MRTGKDRQDITAQMVAYYQRRAPWHDQYLSYIGNAAMEELLAPIIRRFERYLSGRDVLEIACGTGNWTQVLARRARSVTAIDSSRAVLEIARIKEYAHDSVTFRVADAYDLSDIEGSFNAAFAADWWTHMPKSRIPAFLRGLHVRLAPGSKVIVVDMMPAERGEALSIRIDSEGNRIEKRLLPDGSQFNVVKNFPTESELRQALSGLTTDLQFHNDLALKRWVMLYTNK